MLDDAAAFTIAMQEEFGNAKTGGLDTGEFARFGPDVYQAGTTLLH